MSGPHRIWTKLDKGYSLTTESIGREVRPPVAVPGGPVQPDGCIELLRAAVGVRVSEAEGVHGEWSGGPPATGSVAAGDWTEGGGGGGGRGMQRPYPRSGLLGPDRNPQSQREDFPGFGVCFGRNTGCHFCLHNGHPIGGVCLVVRTPRGEGWSPGY